MATQGIRAQGGRDAQPWDTFKTAQLRTETDSAFAPCDSSNKKQPEPAKLNRWLLVSEHLNRLMFLGVVLLNNAILATTWIDEENRDGHLIQLKDLLSNTLIVVQKNVQVIAQTF